MHRELDRYVSMIPAPFDEWTSDVVQGAHAVLDSVRDEVAFAFFVDDKGQAAVLVAGRLKDAQVGQAALRKVLQSTASLGERYRVMVGDDRDYRYKLEYKPDGLGFSKAKVDLLSSTVPKAFLEDAKKVSMFLGTKKPKLEILSLVEGDYGIVVAGIGARGVMSDWVRGLGQTPTNSAETEGGLARARALGGGCQLCLSVEPVGALQAWLRHRADFNGDEDAKSKLKEAEKLKPAGLMAISLRANDDEAALGLGAPASLLFSEPPLLPAFLSAITPPPEPEAAPKPNR